MSALPSEAGTFWATKPVHPKIASLYVGQWILSLIQSVQFETLQTCSVSKLTGH
jgi:hypothetical protein